MVLRFSEEVDPSFEKVYHSIPRGVSKADIGRYLVLYYLGGIYLDNDIILKNGNWINILDKYPNGVWFTEKMCKSSEQFGKREKKYLHRIANYAIALSNPKSQLVKDIIVESSKRIKNLSDQEWSDEDVLWATGPDVVTTILTETYLDGFKILNLEASKSALSHKATGSWRNKEDK